MTSLGRTIRSYESRTGRTVAEVQFDTGQSVRIPKSLARRWQYLERRIPEDAGYAALIDDEGDVFAELPIRPQRSRDRISELEAQIEELRVLVVGSTHDEEPDNASIEILLELAKSIAAGLGPEGVAAIISNPMVAQLLTQFAHAYHQE